MVAKPGAAARCASYDGAGNQRANSSEFAATPCGTRILLMVDMPELADLQIWQHGWQGENR